MLSAAQNLLRDRSPIEHLNELDNKFHSPNDSSTMDTQPKNDAVPTARVVEDGGQTQPQLPTRRHKDHYEPETDKERKLDRRINLKFDFFVSAPISLGFTLIAIDKSNIGYVATSTFIEDAHVTPNAVGLSLTLFSATYVPLHPINTMLSFAVGPRYWIAGQLFSCGVVSACHALINGNGSLTALRLLLGAVEAGYNPCCIFLMTRFYPRKNLGTRMGAFTCMFALSSSFAGLITYGLLSVASRVLRGWQLVFIVEGSLTVLNSIAVFFSVPPRVETAWFLTAEEKEHVVMRMKADRGAATQEDMAVGEDGGEPAAEAMETTCHVTWRDITDVLKDWKKLLIIFWGICAITAMNALPAFLPLLIEGMGYEGTRSNLMSVPPFAVSIVLLMIFTSFSDRIGDRSGVIIGSLLMAAVATVVMAAVDNNAIRYVASHICVPFVLIGGSMISVWLANNTMESGARSFVLGLNGLTHIGGVIAGQIFNVKYAPKYKIPLFIMAALLVAGALGLGHVRYLYVRENKDRARRTAGWGEAEFAQERKSDVRRGEQRFDHRMVL